MKTFFASSYFILFLQIFAIAQDTEFKLSEAGITDFIVVAVDSVSAKDQYKKCIEWIGKTYKNPNEVIKSKIDSSSIRIEGASNGLVNISGVSYPTRYQVEISFREGRYKFDLLSIETYSAQNGWGELPIGGSLEGYYKNGELKKVWSFWNDIPPYFNDLSSSLKTYILNTGNSEEDKW